MRQDISHINFRNRKLTNDFAWLYKRVYPRVFLDFTVMLLIIIFLSIHSIQRVQDCLFTFNKDFGRLLVRTAEYILNGAFEVLVLPFYLQIIFFKFIIRSELTDDSDPVDYFSKLARLITICSNISMLFCFIGLQLSELLLTDMILRTCGRLK
ncbi:Hypothetical_protein [Hexamita inflata]|uniref:Hypothetical_protein n=1 Tax=Hexamita inflata TaxID=28002 RepID=A0AA86QNH4_9EUKA|nr:Hypothetical protein HINF_LOCUS47547 [Hexamita inflata]